MIRILIVTLLILSQTLYGQQGTFKGYVTAGTNLSQIEGDSVAGFNKWGFVGGIGTYFMFLPKFSANLEINYSQRGASGVVYDESNQGLYHRTIYTDYIEVPIMVNYHDKNIAKFGAGVVVSSLLNTSQRYNHVLIDANEGRVKDVYKDMEVGMVFSATFNILRHFGFNMRFVHSVMPINKNNLYGEDQFHSFLSVRGMYVF